jgi:hypothetical protein
MLDKKYIELIQTIAKRYGKEKQVLQAVEEMAELQKELIKNVNRNKDNKKEIILEIADVEIMLMQLVDIYNIEPNKLIGAMEYKLLRQKERIERYKQY